MARETEGCPILICSIGGWFCLDFALPCFGISWVALLCIKVFRWSEGQFCGSKAQESLENVPFVFFFLVLREIVE